MQQGWLLHGVQINSSKTLQRRASLDPRAAQNNSKTVFWPMQSPAPPRRPWVVPRSAAARGFSTVTAHRITRAWNPKTLLGPLNSLVWYVRSLRYTRGLAWRIHCGVEVTESSTNKQHHLFHWQNNFFLSFRHFIYCKKGCGETISGTFYHLLFLQF